MKKTFIIITILCLSVISASAQSKFAIYGHLQRSEAPYFYIKANAGYNFQFAVSSASQHSETSTATTDSRHDELSTISLGSGFNPGGSIGGMFTDYVGAEVDFKYLIGSKHELRNTTSYTNPGSGLSTEDITTYKPTMTFISPMIVFQAPISDIVKLYAKMGPTLSFGTMIVNETYTYTPEANTGTPYDTDQETKYSGGMGIGMSGAVGMEFEISSMVSLFGEASFISLSHAYTKSELTSSKYNGADDLATKDVRDRQTEYVDSYDTDMMVPVDVTQARKAIKEYMAMSGVGVQVGLKICIGKSK